MLGQHQTVQTICAAVLTFEIMRGRTGIGLPISQDSMNAPTIMMSRDTTRMTSQQRQRAGDAQRHIDRDDQRLVGQRIEIGAELARHVEALGEKAVDGVADPGDQEQHKGDPHLARL